MFGRVQLAVDTTLVSTLRGDGAPIRGASRTGGVVLQEALARKARTHTELVREGGRVRLVVLAGNVGCRWSAEAQDFLCALAKAKSV